MMGQYGDFGAAIWFGLVEKRPSSIPTSHRRKSTVVPTSGTSVNVVLPYAYRFGSSARLRADTTANALDRQVTEYKAWRVVVIPGPPRPNEF